MARTLTTPKVETIPQQAIWRFRFEVPQKRNVGDTGMEVDTAGIYVHFEVQSFDADGEVVNTSFAVGNFADWPANFKTDVQSVYSVLTNYAMSLGLIAGTGTDDPIG